MNKNGNWAAKLCYGFSYYVFYMNSPAKKNKLCGRVLQFLKNKLLTHPKVVHHLYKNTHSRAFFGLMGLTLREMRVAPSQFFSGRYPLRSTVHLFQIYCSILLRLALGRNVKLIYGFFGEDRLLEGLLKPKIGYRGFYVDVGSNHPKFLSNTFGLYRKGWRGICIDANETLIEKHRRLRPRDNAIVALVSSSKSVREFYLVENVVLSTTSRQNIAAIEAESLAYTVEEKSTETLTDILYAYNAPPKFELLSIDAEEHDFEVLKGLDFQIFRPTLIVVEDETFQIDDPFRNKIYRLLVEQEYRLEGYVLKNMYFMDSSRT